MAHPLGALYDTPHGIANAIILPTVMEYNAEATGDKYKYIAEAMGVDTTDMSQEEYRKAAVDAVKQLAADGRNPGGSERYRQGRRHSVPRTERLRRRVPSGQSEIRL